MHTPASAAHAEKAVGAHADGDFAESVRRGLSLTRKKLEPAYFYDALGSALFDAITRLPEYTIARAEKALLKMSAGEILEAAGRPAELIELGPGNGEKLELLASASRKEPGVHLIDVSSAALRAAASRFRERGQTRVSVFEGTFLEGLRNLPSRKKDERRLVLFLGSNIGNFMSEEATVFLRSIRACFESGDGLVIGADLVKAEHALLAAYDDPLGVTAAFNKNILLRMNRELGANFDLLGFDHRALWKPDDGRVEMHLVSLVEQSVLIPALKMRVNFRSGETIWTESSHKYHAPEFRHLVECGGFHFRAQWLNADHQFLEALFVV